MSEQPLYYLVWSHERKAWWRAGEHGYTDRLEEAGRFREDRARDICRDAMVDGIPFETLFPAEDYRLPL